MLFYFRNRHGASTYGSGLSGTSVQQESATGSVAVTADVGGIYVGSLSSVGTSASQSEVSGSFVGSSDATGTIEEI